LGSSGAKVAAAILALATTHRLRHGVTPAITEYGKSGPRCGLT